MQAITEIAKTVGHLTVFQRTPNWCAPLHNSRDRREARRPAIKATYPEIFARCRDSFGCFIHAADPRKALEVSAGGARGVLREALQRARLRHLDGQLPRRADRRGRPTPPSPSSCAGRSARGCSDPKVAEKLIPTNHGFGTRRVPLESGYYEVYNQPNVRLVDMRETPIERITPAGIKTSDAEYEFDMIIYATGFDAITGAFDRIDIRGARRPAAPGQVGGWAAHLSRPADRGLPQPVHAGRAAQRRHVLQHPALHRAERGLGDRAHRAHAREGPRPRRGHRRGGARLGPSTCTTPGGACCSPRWIPG